MQINLKDYKKQDYICLRCDWKGKGSEMAVDHLSGEHFIIDFKCPKCGEHIGSGQSNSDDDDIKDEVETENN